MVKRLKLMKLKFVWYLNVSGTVDSSVVRMVTGLANWVLGRIFRAGEREAEPYVTGIVCWQQIVLGGLDKGWEGKGVGELWDSCWENIDDESEDNLIKNSVIFKYLISCTNKNNVWLSNKCVPRKHFIIILKFIAVTSGSHSEHDPEPACFIICTLLEALRHPKLHCTPCSTWKRSTDAMCVRF